MKWGEDPDPDDADEDDIAEFDKMRKASPYTQLRTYNRGINTSF